MPSSEKADNAGVHVSTKRLHVLQVTGAMNRGGAEVMLMDIYRHLSSDSRFDFLINVKGGSPRPQGDFDDEIVRLGGRLRYIRTQWDLGIIRYILHFRKIIQDIGRPDVVHIHLNAKCGVIALAARVCGIRKVIAHSHAALKFRGPLLKVLPSLVELKLQKMLIALFATDYWGCSEAANRSLFYGRLLNKPRPVVISNAVNVEAFQSVPESRTREIRSTYKLTPATVVLGNVGRVVRHKKVDFVVDVIRILKERKLDVVFAFAGREDDAGYMNEIMHKATEYRVGDRVLHLGDRGDVPAVMSAFDVFVGPAVNEGFGLVAAEAQAAGVPCVLSTGFPRSVDMGLNLVTYVDGYEPERWADAILKARGRRCSDKNAIRRQIVERGFDAATNAKRIEQLYRA